MQKLSLIFIIAALFSACSTGPTNETAEKTSDSEIVELTPEQNYGRA